MRVERCARDVKLGERFLRVGDIAESERAASGEIIFALSRSIKLTVDLGQVTRRHQRERASATERRLNMPREQSFQFIKLKSFESAFIHGLFPTAMPKENVTLRPRKRSTHTTNKVESRDLLAGRVIAFPVVLCKKSLLPIIRSLSMKVLVGPANSGKTERIIERVGRALTEGRSAMLVVPSSSAAEVINNRLAASLQGQLRKKIQQTVKTFPALYTRILNDAEKHLTILDPIERERLLRQVIAELAETGRLVYFAETADRAGFINAVAAFIDELWRAGADPSLFERVAQSRQPKDRDLTLIFAAYADALASIEATDAEGAGVAALGAIEAMRDDSLSKKRAAKRAPELSLVAIDGFDFYSPVQVLLLKALADCGVEVVATLTYEDGRAVHLWQKRTRERLDEARAEIVECAARPTTLIERAAAQLMRDDVTAHEVESDGGELNESLRLNDEQSNDSRKPSIKIISTPDRAAEVRAVAHEIKRLVIEEGFAASGIAIVCRQLSLYAHHLERIFSECSIPLSLDCAISLEECPPIIALMRLLAISSKSFPRRGVIDLLRSPYFDLSPFGLDELAVDALDRISLRGNVTREREQWLEAINGAAEKKDDLDRHFDDGPEDGSDEQRVNRRLNLAASLNGFFDIVTPAGYASRGQFAHWLLGLIEQFRVDQRATHSETAVRDVKALEQFCTLVKTIAADRHAARFADESAAGEIRWPQFYEEIKRAVASASMERPATIGPAVIAQEVHHIRPARWRAVFVLGLIEGEFPMKISEGAPYTIAEREELRRAGIDLTETTADAGADLTQFYKTMSRATERLYLTHARTDASGSELLASYLIEEVSRVAPAETIRIAQSATDEGLTARDVASLDELALRTARVLRDRLANGLSTPQMNDETRAANQLLAAELPSWGATIRNATVEHRRLRGEQGEFDGIILNDELLRQIKASLGPQHLWSASQINDYGVCPFRFFAKHILKLESAAEPVEGFAPNRLGNTYHEILERLYSLLQNNEGDAVEASSLVEQVAEEILERVIARGQVRKSPLWEFEKSEIKRRLVKLLQKEAEWNRERPARPLHFERKFGTEGEQPLVIKTDEGEIRLCGKIDRIDERDDGLVVIDYKTGRTPIPHRDALDGRNLQLPIYVMAAREVVAKGANIAAAYYLHINSRKRGSELPRESDANLSIEAIIEHAERRIVDYVNRARGGKFPVRPNNDRCHPSCEFEVMCRIQSSGSTAIEEE